MSKKNRRRKPAAAAPPRAHGEHREHGAPGEPTIPPRLATRPVEARRGLPIPYVSEHERGRVDFAAVDGARALECAHRRLCGLCGLPHEAQVAFIGGPAGFHQRLYTDPPGHVDCMRAALRLCPYLALRRHRRGRGTTATAAAGFTDMEKAQPVILAVTTGYTWHLWGPAGQPPAVLFHAAPWRWAVRLDYRAGTLTETGPQPL